MPSTNRSSAFSSWIFDSFRPSAEGLGLYRIFGGLFLLLFLVPKITTYQFISTLPDDFFLAPPGPMLLLEGFPPYWFFIALHALLILALCLVVAGWYTKVFSLVAAVLLLILRGYIYSIGKINHDILIIVLLFVMAFSGWGKAYSLDSYFGTSKDKKVRHWLMTLLALILGFMFFTAGFSKLIGGWLYFESQATYGHVFRQYFVYGRQDLLAGFATTITAPAVWEVFDYLTVLFEVGFLAAILRPRTSRIFICFAVLFHFSIMMILNISFLPNFLVYAAFLDWTFINKKLKGIWQRTGSTGMRAIGPPVSVAIGVILLWAVVAIAASYIHFKSDLLPKEFIILCLSLPIALCWLGKEMRSLLPATRT